MAYDLIFKNTKANWARDGLSARIPSPILPSSTPVAPRAKLVLTPGEKKSVEAIAVVKMKAASGDPAAKKKWKKISARLAAVKASAAKGDPKARRACQVLLESGLFGRTQEISLSGSDLPRKASPFTKSDLVERAKKGDVAAQIELRRVKSRELANAEELSLGALVGRQEITGVEKLLGAFVGDEERTARDAGSAERDASSRIRGRNVSSSCGRRDLGRRVQRLSQRAARGDAAASAKLQRINTRLSQRAATGDPRAVAALSRVQALESQNQAPGSPGYTTPYQAPGSPGYTNPFASVTRPPLVPIMNTQFNPVTNQYTPPAYPPVSVPPAQYPPPGYPTSNYPADQYETDVYV